jgi:K+-transporting ATPase KdpF subunit
MAAPAVSRRSLEAKAQKLKNTRFHCSSRIPFRPFPLHCRTKTPPEGCIVHHLYVSFMPFARFFMPLLRPVFYPPHNNGAISPRIVSETTLSADSQKPGAGGSSQEDHMDFIIAGLIAFLLTGYLVYALTHPEKF